METARLVCALVLGAATLTVHAQQQLQLEVIGLEPGQRLPAQYTCDGQGTSPPLRWSTPPPGTRSLALLVEDPDAPRGVFTHWLVYGIPAGTHGTPDGAPPAGARVGVSSAGKTTYAAACPPRGEEHRYVFRLFALDADLKQLRRPDRAQLLRAMQGHVLASAEVTGTSRRMPGAAG